MSELHFTLFSGELCGEGCGKGPDYVKARVRRYVRSREWATGGLTQAQRANLAQLLADYGGSWWRFRNGYLVSALAREAYLEIL